MAYTLLPSLSERLSKINAEISGVTSQYNITAWEKTFLKSLESLKFGSDKQLQVLSKLEIKVFGYSEYNQLMAAHHKELRERDVNNEKKSQDNSQVSSGIPVSSNA